MPDQKTDTRKLQLVVRTEDGEEVVGTIETPEPDRLPAPTRDRNYRGYVPKRASEILADMERVEEERLTGKRDRRLARRFARRMDRERAFYEAMAKSMHERVGRWESMQARVALAIELAKHRRFVALAPDRRAFGAIQRVRRRRLIERQKLRWAGGPACPAYTKRGTPPPWWHGRAWPPPYEVICEECNKMIGDW